MSGAAQLGLAAAAALFDGLAGGESLEVVVSPGSRSTPLALAALDRGRVHVVLDERAAGFLALGLARASGRAAVLVCTSGSAGANYLPAVVEAHHARVPLIIVTADRPPELHHSGAPQCMRQDGLFRGWVRHEAVLPVPSAGISPRVFLHAGGQARAASAAGPVHLDAPFREPLWDADSAVPAPLPAPRSWDGPRQLASADIDALAATLGRRGVVVAGPAFAADRGLEGAVRAFIDASGWPLLADPASGLRFGLAGFASYDLACRSEALDALRPDVALTLGLAPTSKPLKQWLDRLEVPRVHLDAEGSWTDPGHRLAAVVAADPALTLAALAPKMNRERDARWGAVHEAIVGALAAPLGDGFWSGRLAQRLVESLPAHAQLHLASSMPIREVDAFGVTRTSPLRVQASRGVNGIDGTVATSLGEALAHDGPTVTLLGDLATLHDLDGLETAVATDAPLTLCVLDNGGGGIFDHLPVAQHPEPSRFERLFITPRAANVADAAGGLGARVSTHETLAGWEEALAEAVERPGLDVIVARVDRRRDLEMHRRCRALAADAVATALAAGGAP